MVRPDNELTTVRLDLWLWAARFFKTRALAKQAVEGGKVLMPAGPVSKPARLVRAGDQLSIRRGEELFSIEVLAVALKRGPASDAQQLFREEPESIARREAEREKRRLEQPGLNRPPSRPDKKSRRQIRALPGGKATRLPPWLPE